MQAGECFKKWTSPLFKDRVYPNAAKEGTPAPFCAYIEARDTENTIDDGFSGDAKVRLQAYIFADSYGAVHKLRDAVIRVMDAAFQAGDTPSCTTSGDQYQFESQTQLHLVVVDFVMWEKTK